MGKTFRRASNEQYADGARQLRRSNAAGPHLDSRTGRKRTRANQEDYAIKDSLKEDTLDDDTIDYWSALEDPSEHM